MKCWQLTGSAENPVLTQRESAQPVPREGEVLVRIHAAGITPTEVIWWPTTHTQSGEPRTNPVLSHEFSGELEGGEAVYGMNDWFVDGALAEYCVTRPEWIAPKPATLTHPEAATVPIGALTAWQGLFDKAHLQPGERVLIHGGAGAVGVFAVQFAKQRGAHVVTTVSARNFEFVRSLGAAEVLDYQAEAFDRVLHGIDVVFDTVGGQTLDRSWNVLRPGGRLVTIAAGSEATQDERTKAAFFIVEPKRDQLIAIGQQIDAGEVRPIVDALLPWTHAADAFEHRHGRGKTVVQVT